MKSIMLVCLVGCAVEPRIPDPAPDAMEPPPGADAPLPAPVVCYEPGVTADVHPGASSLESCAIWNHDQSLTGQAMVTRAQDTITMTFAGGLAFVGSVGASSVTLTHSELHDFDDGCTWRATETLTGAFDPTTCVLNLTYHYTEAVEIDNGWCAIPCSGAGSLSIQVSPVIL